MDAMSESENLNELVLHCVWRLSRFQTPPGLGRRLYNSARRTHKGKGMATADSPSQNTLNVSSVSSENGPAADISASLEKVSIQRQEEDPTRSTNSENHDSPRRRLHVYRRPQVLFLSKSPLVKTPEGMPALKDWFG